MLDSFNVLLQALIIPAFIGAKVIADLIGKSTSLKHVDVSHNYIKNGGAIGIVNAAASNANSVLEKLNLSNNMLTDDGIVYVAGVVARMPGTKLQECFLDSNCYDRDGRRGIESAKRRRPGINFDSTVISDEQSAALKHVEDYQDDTEEYAIGANAFPLTDIHGNPLTIEYV